MRKKLINPPQIYDGSQFGMSQAVIDTASSTVYISGQVDWHTTDRYVSSHTVEGQLKTALTKLTTVLEASGSSVESLLSLRLYIRGEVGDFREEIALILAQYLGESRPSLTVIGVSSLAYPEILVEIEATAAFT
jgi:2-iminobutanoate/2-iminopropanoate deaminase